MTPCSGITSRSHAVVEELAGFGAAVHTCSRKESELADCLQKWEKMGFSVTGSICDISLRSEREKLVEKAAAAFGGKLNILVSLSAPRSTPSVDCFIFLVHKLADRIASAEESRN